jgi:cytochrome c
MWNHGPAMAARMKERGLEVPKLSGQEMADILAYLYTSHYFERAASPRRGRQVIQAKGCLTCHSVGGKGGKIAADFATSTVVGSPASLVAGMWNHSVMMEAQAQKQQVSWPELSGQDLGDVAAYFASLAKPKPGAAPKPAAK